MSSKHIILTEWQHVSYTNYFRIIHNIILLKTGQFCERKKWHIAFMKFLSDLNLLAICNSSYKLCQALYSEMSLMMGLPKLTLTAKTWYSTAQFCLEIIEEGHALKFQWRHENAQCLGLNFCCLFPLHPSCSAALLGLKWERWQNTSQMGTEVILIRALFRSWQAKGYFKCVDYQACGCLHMLCTTDWRRRKPSFNKFWTQLSIQTLTDPTCRSQEYKNRAQT